MARFASIDVGSNALRLRIIEATSAREVREVRSERAPVRLGRDVFLTGKLAPVAIADAVEALRIFRDTMRASDVDAYRAVATSAVRDAANGDVLVERAEREAGIKLEVIEGVEEARLARVAVAHAVKLEERRVLLVDVGGGSVEFTLVHAGSPAESVSLPLGTVRLSEAFLDREAPVTDARRALLEEYIVRLLHEAPFLKGLRPDAVVATGGNAEALGELAPMQTADGPGIDVAAMGALRHACCGLSVRERRERFGLRGDRADVIVPAMFVLGAVAQTVGVNALVTPGVGLKDGILAELVERAFRVWDVGGEAQSVEDELIVLGRKYRFDEAHALHVANLSASLFDALTLLHGLGPEERALLRLGALSHDLGDFVGYEAHHKHTYYLVAHSDLMGLSPEARELVANVGRYHRKAFPDLSHPGFRKLERRERAVVRKLSAIVRLADAFDREHLGKVKEVVPTLEADKKRLTLQARGEGDLGLSRWTASRKADLFEEVFELEVRVEGAEHVDRFPAYPSTPPRG